MVNLKIYMIVMQAYVRIIQMSFSVHSVKVSRINKKIKFQKTHASSILFRVQKVLIKRMNEKFYIWYYKYTEPERKLTIKYIPYKVNIRKCFYTISPHLFQLSTLTSFPGCSFIVGYNVPVRWRHTRGFNLFLRYT